MGSGSMHKIVLSVICYSGFVYGQSLELPSVGPMQGRASHRAADAGNRTLPPSFLFTLSNPPEYRLGRPQDNELAQMKNNPRAVGFTRALDPSVMDQGAWETLSDGTEVWRLAIQSPGASAIRIHFKGFAVGDGQVFLYTGEGDNRQVAGPYTGGGIFGDGDFWSGVVNGDSAVLEYLPSGRSDPSPFTIRELAHLGSRDSEPFAATLKKAGERAATPNCYSPNAIDNPVWPLASSVGLMLSKAYNGSWGTCTGTAVSDRGGNGRFFLTANHCVSTDAQARTVVVYWNFDNPASGTGYDVQQQVWVPGLLGIVLPQTTGATLRATSLASEGDATLLELATLPPPTVGYSGWSAAFLSVGVPAVGIHHPNASWKRVSTGLVGTVDTTSAAGLLLPRDYFVRTYWTEGSVEKGSSGSGLFVGAGYLSGTLTTGLQSNGVPTCQGGWGEYGRFSTFFPRVQAPINDIAPGTCNVSITGMNHTAAVVGETGSFSVNAPSQCAWAVASDSDWITITSPKVGMGNGTVSYAVNANLGLLTPPRLGSLSVIGEQRRVVHIDQPGTNGYVIYPDVPATHPYFDHITLLSGTGPFTSAAADPCSLVPYLFCPDGVTTRGLMSQFIIRSIYGGENNIPLPLMPQYFTDVPIGHPYYTYIQLMRYMGITVGCSATMYCPDRPVTRSEMSVFIIRALNAKNLITNQEMKQQLSPPLTVEALIAGDPTLINTFSYTATPLFTDVPSTHPHFVYVQKMKDLGITSGCLTGATYCPNDPNTRGQISVFLARGLFALWNSRPN